MRRERVLAVSSEAVLLPRWRRVGVALPLSHAPLLGLVLALYTSGPQWLRHITEHLYAKPPSKYPGTEAGVL